MKTVDYTPRLAWDDRLGLPHGTVERTVHNTTSWVQAQTGLIPVEAYWDDVAQQLKITADEVKQLSHDFYSGDQLDKDLISYIQDLRQNGHTVALLSNDSTELTAKLDHLQITHLFDPLVISAHIGVMKPDPAAYHAVLKQLQRPPEETIFIDDRLENVQGAMDVGIHGIHYKADLKAVLANLVNK